MWFTIIDGLPYLHPVAVLTVFLLGAQVPNFVRLVTSISRIIRRILPY